LDFVKNPVEYKHSSAKFYSRGEQGVYLIKRPITTWSRDTAGKRRLKAHWISWNGSSAFCVGK